MTTTLFIPNATDYADPFGDDDPDLWSVPDLPEYRKFQDVTITEWNNVSNKPSELHKMCCDWIVYAYFDEYEFYDETPVDAHAFKDRLRRGELAYKRNENKKGQHFLCFKFGDLRNAGVVMPLHDWADVAAYEQAAA